MGTFFYKDIRITQRKQVGPFVRYDGQQFVPILLGFRSSDTHSVAKSLAFLIHFLVALFVH